MRTARSFALITTLALLSGVGLAQVQTPPAPASSLTPAGRVITNVAWMDTLDGPSNQLVLTPHASNPVNLTVAAVCGVTLTPPELRQPGQVGIPASFSYTVTNTGNAPFTFALTTSGGGGDANVSVQPQSVSLQAGESQTVSVTMTVTQPGAHTAQLTTSCAGEQRPVNVTATLDAARLPLSITKAVNTVQALPGDVLTYTLNVTNPNAADVTQATVTDTLPEHLSFVSSTPEPDSTTPLSFTLPVIAAHSTQTITIQAKVAQDHDALSLKNVAQAAVSGETPQTSNEVTTNVWDGKLVIQKDSDLQAARIGDHIHYTVTVTNASTDAAFSHTDIVDTLPPGLSLDTSSLTLGGVSVSNTGTPPTIHVRGPALKAHESLTLTYSASVLPSAAGQGRLTNTVYATGTPDNPTTLPDIRSATADATVVVNVPQRGTLIGRVFLDRNDNGKFDSDTDQPVAQARILIAGVGSVLTDSRGRYGIPDLRAGRYGLNLQSSSLGGDPQEKGGDYGLNGARIAEVAGLTVVDFPLTPPQATLSTSRSTEVHGHGLTLSKTVTPSADMPGLYTVSIIAALDTSAQRAVSVTIHDLLPSGMKVVSGDSTQTLTLQPGSIRQMSYRMSGYVTPERRVTDPDVSVTEVNP